MSQQAWFGVDRRRRSADAQCKANGLDYAAWLAKIVELTKNVNDPSAGASYPTAINSGAKRALYDNLGGDEPLAFAVDADVRYTRKDDWRNNGSKAKEVLQAINRAVNDPRLRDLVFNLVHSQHEY